MEIMCNTKGTDNEFAFCGESLSYSQLRRAVYTLAFNKWLQQLNMPLDSNSESGGKLTLL